MKGFTSVWELYAEGGLRELQPINAPSQKLPTNSWETFTTSLDEVSHFDPAEVYSLSLETPLQSLKGIVSNLSSIEKTGEEVLSRVNPSSTIYGHLLRLAKAQKHADEFLESSFKKTYSSFVPHANSLFHELTLSETIHERAVANRFADTLNVLHSLMNERKLHFPIDSAEHVNSYNIRRNHINSLEKEIYKLEFTYQDLSLDKSGLKDLSKIRKRIKGSFLNQGIYGSCKGNRYFEGLARLDNLLKDIDSVKHNSVSYTQKKTFLQSAISDLGTLLASSPNKESLQKAVLTYSPQAFSEDSSVYLQPLSKRFNYYSQRLSESYAEFKKDEPAMSQPKIIHMTPSPKQEIERSMFSLGAYLHRVGEPDNFYLSPIMDSLTGLNGGKSWADRFSRYQNALSRVKLSNSGDYGFLKEVSSGLQFAIDQPDIDMDVSAAKKAHFATLKVLDSYAA